MNPEKREENTFLFVGSYTDKKPGKGIKVFTFNHKTGETSLTYEVENIINPSFLKLAPSGKYLYSVVESQMPHQGKIAAFEIDSTLGKLALINIQDCGGRNPAHIEIDRMGEHLIASNYTDPSLSVFKIDSSGALHKYHQIFTFEGKGIIKERQATSHIHSSNFSPSGNSLFVQDLGSDKIYKFKVKKDENNFLTLSKGDTISVKEGSGPRHFTFHPNGHYGYGITEMSGDVLAFKNRNETLVLLYAYKAYEKNQEIYRSADIHISPDGKFLYASNRGPQENSIVIYSINQKKGTLKLVGHQSTFGDHPRNFVIDPSGKFLLVSNQNSNNIIVFKRDLKTGMLQKLKNEIFVSSPSSLQMRTYKI